MDPADLPRRVRWRVADVEIEGAGPRRAGELRPLLATRRRSRWTPWKERPRFEREALTNDLARVAAFYRERGFYRAEVSAELEVDRDDETVTVVIHIDEREPVVVEAVRVEVVDPPADGSMRDPPPRVVPLRPDDVFTEARYDEGRARLLAWARGHEFARASVEKRARVDVAAGTARIHYTVTLGPRARFGPVTVQGLERVSRETVMREVAFREGAPFDPALLERTRRQLLQLRLFRTVTLAENDSRDPVVHVNVQVAEGPHREVRAGIGYDTEEEVRGLLAWRSYDFFGGARQLGFTARASTLRRTAAADFLQPHWPLDDTRARLLLTFEETDEETYTLTQGRASPRLEWQPTLRVLGFLAYRHERDHLSDVDQRVARALHPDATPEYATVSGFSLGIDWNNTDDLANPTRGWIVGGALDPVASALGGDVDFVRLLATLRLFAPLPWRMVVATRTRFGTIEPFGGTEEIPLWERFYAGGIDSVRGYARRRVGPLADDQPLGGRSLIDCSIELRRPVTQAIAASVFVDAGQLSLQSFDVPAGDLQFGTGVGLLYATPIGPIRFDIGIPLDRRGEDDAWQFHVSVGQAF